MPAFWPTPLLAIETSCDETAAAVLEGQKILSNVVASQIEMHQKWGGVVPEAAARAHVEAILPVIDQALHEAGRPKITAVAVTNRPGLVGALSVGVSAAKALAASWNVPLIGVHHIEGHVFSPWATDEVTYPNITLVVSGGHTELFLAHAPGDLTLLGETLDDAAGEAFDKGARLLGLGYPGGKAIQNAAETGDPKRYPLPRALPKDPYHFSFSGLKTAVLRLVQKEGAAIHVPDAAASLQAAIVDVLVKKTLQAADRHEARAVCLVGGVSANARLRESLSSECARSGLRLHVPPFALSTDNAAMIGLAGSYRLALGERDDHHLDVVPNAPVPGCRQPLGEPPTKTD